MEENKYKAALERAKSAIKECGNNLGRIKMIESIFPELKESDDERIRKKLIEYFKGLIGGWSPYSNEEIIAYLEKMKDFDEQLDKAYKKGNGVFFSKGYDAGYAEGKAFAKQELVKQNEKPATISVDKMVEEFIDARIEANGICQIIESDAYRKGVNDALSKILIKEEKPITIGSKKAEGKLGEMIAASKEPAESGENKELSHKEVTKKSVQDDKWKWDEDDEKFFRENILIGLGNIDDVNPELYSKIIDWISLIKRRLS